MSHTLHPPSYSNIASDDEALRANALTTRSQSYSLSKSPMVPRAAMSPLSRSKTSYTPGRYARPPQCSPIVKSQIDVTVSSKIHEDFFILPKTTSEAECIGSKEAILPKKEEGHEGGEKEELPFPKSKGLTTAQAHELLEKYGKNCLDDKSTPKWLIFLRLLYQPMPLMIWLAIIVEAAIENWQDMGILLGIQFANAFLGFYETTKAGDAVAALRASLKPEATVNRDGKWQTIDATLLVPSDLVLLGSGAAVPADCSINESQVDVDQSALTGESLPVTLYAGDLAKMGSTVTRGEVQGTVQFTGKDTFFGKTASLLQTGNELGNLQKILIRIMLVLVVLSLSLCVTCLIYLLCMKEPFKEALSFTVVVLVASVPVAIEIVVTTTLAVGSRQLAAHGAIVVRLAAIEDMAGMNILCSDKTGTLTLNKMVIQDHTPTYVEGENQASVLLAAAMAAKWHEPARDALDTLVLGSANLSALHDVQQLDYMPFDPTQKRTEGTVKLPSGQSFKTTKGAPHIICRLIKDSS